MTTGRETPASAEDMRRQIFEAMTRQDTDETMHVFLAIRDERAHQSHEWGDEHDDRHGEGDWTRFIVRHLGRAEQAIEDGKREEWRRQMVRVASLAVAALEVGELRIEALTPEASHG